jgi:hypothetical protein
LKNYLVSCEAGLAAEEAERKRKSFFDVGRAIHSWYLEGFGAFDETVAIFKGAVRRGEKWEEFKANHPHHDILKKEEAEVVERCVDALKQHPLSAGLTKSGHSELTGVWQLPCGTLAKARYDHLELSPEVVYTDLKNMARADAEGFAWDVGKFWYHGQLAWYRAGLEALLESSHVPADRMRLLAVEKGSGAVARYTLPEDALFEGYQATQVALDRWRIAKESLIQQKRVPGLNNDKETILEHFRAPRIPGEKPFAGLEVAQ